MAIWLKWVRDPIPVSSISAAQENLPSTWGRIAWLEALAVPSVDIGPLKGPNLQILRDQAEKGKCLF